MVRAVFSYGSHKAAVLLLFVLSLVLTQVPLFNYLGYEFSVVIALVWSLTAGLLTISLWNKSSSESIPPVTPFLARSIALSLIPLLVPAVVISMNAFFVRNCSFLQGAVLFLLIVVPAVLLTHAFSFLIAVSVRRWRKTLFVSGWLLMLAQIGYVTFTRPQIFAFNPILGYFAGFTYDETLVIVNRLLMYRIGTLAFGTFLVLEAYAIHHRRTGGSADGGISPSRVMRAASVICLAAASALYVFSDRLSLSSSESSIEQTLGGRTETEHFVISYPDSLLKGIRLEQVAQLHEFYYEQLVRALRVRPAKKIHTFLYASSEQKGRLLGAAGTNFAKPWLWQLHLNLGDVGGTLKHELVHVLAAEFGFPLLRIGINSGLIEGLAVAMERMEYEEPINRLAGMAFATGGTPDVASLFSLSGFMKAPAGVGYTLSGSFCRFLIDRYGMRRFKLLYRTGEFEIIYDQPLTALLRDWRRTLSTFRYSDADLSKAEYLFKRRSIFGKVCARVIANINSETRAFFAERKFSDALASADKSLNLTVSVDAVYQKSSALLRLGRYMEACTFIQEQLRDSTAAASLLTLKLSLGDALWGLDSLEAAMKAYSGLLRTHLSSSWDETLALRLEILLKPALAHDLKSYFLTSVEDSLRVKYLESLAARSPNEPIARYLLAREIISKERYEEALQSLDNMKPWSSPILELARLRRLGQLSFTIGKYEKAKVYFWQSLNYAYRDVHGVEIEEQIRRCDWMGSFPHRLN
jgi:tetratricopeptide (TPR) repeat protein